MSLVVDVERRDDATVVVLRGDLDVATGRTSARRSST
jgi:hypothetical protein